VGQQVLINNLKEKLIATADKLLAIEKWLVGVFVAATVCLILLNVVTRSFAFALFWVDELAIYTMIWAFMLGAACTIRTREGIAVTLLRDLASTRVKYCLIVLGDVLTLLFSALSLVACWLWFDPQLLYSTGFDVSSFIQQSFNFIYREPTSTLGIAKFWVWMIMPIMAVSLFIFSLANLTDSLKAPAQTGGGELR
jgi:TRAP-type C4-dicarboxylate transport system permease small subunit